MDIVNSPENKAWTATHTGPDGIPRVHVHMRLLTEDGPTVFMLTAAAATWIGMELAREGERAGRENVELATARTTHSPLPVVDWLDRGLS